MNSRLTYLIIAFAFFFLGCSSDPNKNLRESLTLYASFDQAEADFAMGDKALYAAASRRSMDSTTQQGLATGVHELEAGGKWGNALRFIKRDDAVLFFKSAQNINHTPQNWSGTISFWLKVSPETELAPGFTDPIQITDTRYDDASIWVDFTRESPRVFRLGILGDRTSWHQDTVRTSARAEYERRLIPVATPPFDNSTWTHVVILYKDLGTPMATYELFLDGNTMGKREGIDDPFNWEPEKSNIYLGLGFVGRMDELAIFNRPLSNEEIIQLNQMNEPFKF
ncbi:MAG: LamG-like jellyroll fold domain-containing protein [Cytophagales bacterium]|nr:LamG-like jellyroll fold domain-containing protein [Cytophagales bacterium]